MGWLPGDFGTARIAERGSEQFFSLQEGEIWNSRIAILAILTYVVQEFASGRHLCAARRARGGAGHPREEGAGRQLAPGQYSRMWCKSLPAAFPQLRRCLSGEACKTPPSSPRAHDRHLRCGCTMLESFKTTTECYAWVGLCTVLGAAAMRS